MLISNFILIIMRKGNWDFAKAFLMFLVMYGHVCPALASESYNDSWCAITRITGLFVMPLFFLISGYFQSTISGKYDLLNKYRKTFFRVGVPLMAWGGVYYISKINKVWCCWEAEDSLGQVLLFFRNAVFDVSNFYWFFSALIICVFLGSLLSLLLKRNKIYGVIALMISLPLFTILKVELFHFTFVWFYYGCGMMYKTFESKFKDLPNYRLTTCTMVCATLLYLVVGYSFYPKYTFYFTSNLIWITSFWFILLRYLLCLLASVCALYWSFKLYKRYKAKPLVAYLTQSGQDTLFLYCGHVLILSCFLRQLVENCYGASGIMSSMPLIRYYVVSPIISVFLYILLYSLAKFLKKFTFFRVLFMGLPTK